MKNSNYNMRILLYSLLVFLISCNEDAQPKFEVEGEIKNAVTKTIYL